jgi:CRISPR-associated endonuclease/helicase Cas3
MLSEAARALWAKSDRGKDAGSWHPVIGHLLDVAACAWEILKREPRSTLELFAQDLQLEVSQARAWVCALVGLHDLGKASPAFQQKDDVGKARVIAAGLSWQDRQIKPKKDTPHSAVSQVVLETLLSERANWNEEAAKWAADAVGAHHGWRVSSDRIEEAKNPDNAGRADWDAARLELFEAVLITLKVNTEARIEECSAGAFQRLAGLTSFADWIGSSFDFIPFTGDCDTYWIEAKAQARAKLDAAGWVQRTPLLVARQSLEDVFAYLGSEKQPFRARPLQVEIDALLEQVDAPSLFIVEAPMGEGKTEAAFYAHLELQRRIGHRGLYVALPTQATGNLMFSRTRTFLEQMGRETPPDLQLLHGATLLNDEYQSMIVTPNTDDEQDRLEGVVARSYFSSRKRALLSEYGVGTVDQALMGALLVKHQFVRLWGLGNRVVVLDEVHAYDTYTGSLIETLVKWLHALGSSVILMSATLPDAKRKKLLEAFGAKDDTEPVRYPRITRVSKKQVTQTHFSSRPQNPVHVQAMRQEVYRVTQTLLDATRDGGCAACIVNTVDRAQALYTALEGHAEGIPVYLFHARYPLEERKTREDEVLDLFGKHDGEGINPNRPSRAILIATQVVEQSLDLDFDVMISDLAPVDLLLQRAGRLHRHAINHSRRHGHAKAVLHIAGLEFDGNAPDLTSDYWNRVYDEFILLKTWLALQGKATLEFPQDIDDLVQTVYRDELPEGISDELRSRLISTRTKRTEVRLGDVIDASQAVIGSPTDTSWQYPGGFPASPDDEPLEPGTKRVSTRKGELSVTVVPLFKHGSKFYLDADLTTAVKTAAQLELADAKAVYVRSLRLSRKPVVWGIEAHARAHFGNTLPWSETPLLRGFLPLVLEEGRAVFSGLEVRLEQQLGIVFNKKRPDA